MHCVNKRMQKFIGLKLRDAIKVVIYKKYI